MAPVAPRKPVDGATCVTLAPLHDRIRVHVLAAERLHGDETPVPVLAKKKCVKGRIWTYVRDDRPFGGTDPPPALFFYSRDRAGKHPRGHLAGWSGILQADAYSGFNGLYRADRLPAPLTEASCRAHSGAKFFELADLAKERALRGIAVGRRNWTFARSDRGADRAAALYTLIETARLNDVDPRA